jgi:hypothetical protein
MARREHRATVNGAERRRRPARFLGCRASLGAPAGSGSNDARASNQLAELVAGELTGPREEDQSLEDGLDVVERVAREHVAEGDVVTLLIVDNRVERRMRATTRLEQVIERGEGRRLRARLVLRTLCHGRRIPTRCTSDMGQIAYQAPGLR